MTAGEKLRMARIRRFLTQAELAEAVNVSPVSIGYYEAAVEAGRPALGHRLAEECAELRREAACRALWASVGPFSCFCVFLLGHSLRLLDGSLWRVSVDFTNC